MAKIRDRICDACITFQGRQDRGKQMQMLRTNVHREARPKKIEMKSDALEIIRVERCKQFSKQPVDLAVINFQQVRSF